MHWVTATDENGVDFHALSDCVEDADGRHTVWVFTDKDSGFKDDVGRVNMKSLKKLEDGKYGA